MKFLVPFILFAFSQVVFSENDIQVDGIIVQKIQRSSTPKISFKMSSNKSVAVLKLKFSENAINAIQHHIDEPAPSKMTSQKLPHAVQLGMNNVPVADQGVHGSCATFAMVEAINALKASGDYYSELCLLNLGKHLSQYGYEHSGWDGQLPHIVLNRIYEYGLIPKNTQKSNGCGGATEYPVNEEDHSNAMTLEEYHQYSEPYYNSGLEIWSQILDINKFITHNVSMDDILQQTKDSLYHGKRLVIGVMLPINENLGLSGTHHYPNDTWVLTSKLEQAAQYLMIEIYHWGGHAMIITGYDDDAVITDEDGNKHQGLLTLRNSWGSDVGDHGDFYMTYDYFKTLGIDLIELIHTAP